VLATKCDIIFDMDNEQQKPRVFRKASKYGLFLGVAVFLVFSVYVFYQIFTSDSSTAILGVVALVYPGALFAGMGFIFGWAITLLLVLPRAQDVSRKKVWQLISVIAIVLIAWFGYNSFLKSPLPRFEGSLAISPDGKKIAFVYGNSGDFDIYVAEVGQWNATRVLDAPVADDLKDASPKHLSFSVDGQNIFFINNQNTDYGKFEARHGIENGYLYKVNLVGGDTQRMGHMTFSEALQSPLGQSFYAIQSSRSTYRLLELNERGEIIREIHTDNDARADDLSISRDGKTLFYTETRSFFRGKDFVIEDTFVKLDPSDAKETFQTTAAAGGRAYIKPEGDRLLVLKGQYSAGDIYEIDFQGGNEKKLTSFQDRINIIKIVSSPLENQFFAIGGTLEENSGYDTIFFSDSRSSVSPIKLSFPVE